MVAFYKLNTGRARGLLPDIPASDRITPAFYNMWTRREVPPNYDENQRTLQRLNPGWQFRMFNGDAVESFILEEYGRTVLDHYLAIDERYGSSRSDLFRFLLIYRLGGAYLDLKSSATVPFDTMIRPDDRYLLAEWDTEDERTRGWGDHPELRAANTPEFQTWNIIAAKGHPSLRHVIERVLFNIDHYIPELHGTGAYGVLRVTGPIAYSLALAERLPQGGHRLVGPHTDLGLVYSIFQDMDAHRGVSQTHYSKQRAPITTLDLRRRALGAGLRVAQAGYRVLSRPPSVKGRVRSG